MLASFSIFAESDIKQVASKRSQTAAIYPESTAFCSFMQAL